MNLKTILTGTFCKIISLCIWILLAFSCSTVARTLTGFKNPKVENIESINTYINDVFDDDITDLYFEEVKDSNVVMDILLMSFEGRINAFDSEGEKICINNEHNCTVFDFIELKSSDLKRCDSLDNSFTNNISSIHSLIEKTKSFETNERLNFDSEMTFVYYWGKFISSENRMKKDFDWFAENVRNISNDATIIRVNCDLRSSWGLKSGEELQIKMKSGGNGVAELYFENLPYDN